MRHPTPNLDDTDPTRRARGGSRAVGAAATGALATGALAVGGFTLGALAVGAAAIGALAIGRLAIGGARIGSLAVDELSIRQLRVNSPLNAQPQFLYRIEPTRRAMLSEGATATEADAIGRHFAYLEGLAAEGRVFMAGRTRDDGPSAFGIVVFAAESEAEALALMQADPAVAEGVMHAELFPYRVALWSATRPET